MVASTHQTGEDKGWLGTLPSMDDIAPLAGKEEHKDTEQIVARRRLSVCHLSFLLWNAIVRQYFM